MAIYVGNPTTLDSAIRLGVNANAIGDHQQLDALFENAVLNEIPVTLSHS